MRYIHIGDENPIEGELWVGCRDLNVNTSARIHLVRNNVTTGEEIYGILLDPGGNFKEVESIHKGYEYLYACGENNGIIDQIFKLRLSDGLEQWSADWGVTGSVSTEYPLGIVSDVDENVYVVGYPTGTATASTVRKYNSYGTQSWGVIPTGPSGWDCVDVDSSGNVYIGSSFGGGGDNVKKLGATGSEVWGYTHGGKVYGIKVHTDGSVYFGGFEGNGGFCARKLTSGGTVSWSVGSILESIFDIDIDSSGNLYVCGQLADNSYMFRKYDSSGTELWETGLVHTVQGPSAISVDLDGYIYVATEFLEKYSNDGNYIWGSELATPLDIQTITTNWKGPLPVRFFDTYDPSQTACSLRQLDNDSTECLVVRRDSDSATQSIGFIGGLIDTDSMETFCGTYSGYVETWFGQGPSASNYVQTTTSKQPQIVDAGSTILINTKPALHFGYTGSVYMESTKTLSSRFTLFSVAELGSTASNASLYRGSSGGGVTAEYRNDLSNFNIRYNGVANYTATGGWDTNQNLIEVLTDSSFTNTIVYKNGTSILNTSTATPIATSGTTAIMGAESTTDATNWNGHIQEMIIYDTYTTTDRAAIETNINDYWGIY
jgi:phage gp37-like protein